MVTVATHPVSPDTVGSGLITRIVTALAFVLLLALGGSAALHENAVPPASSTIALGSDATDAMDGVSNGTAGAAAEALASAALQPVDAGLACCLLLLIVLAYVARGRTSMTLSVTPRLRSPLVAHVRRTTPALTLPQLSVLRT